MLSFQIGCIENLSHLTELRVLNLAGNQISHVNNLAGMDSLAELNLRRNRIRTVVSVFNYCIRFNYSNRLSVNPYSIGYF